MKKIIWEEKAQGALEYMLMLALALAIVAVLLTFISGKATDTKQKAVRAFNYSNESIEAFLEEALK